MTTGRLGLSPWEGAVIGAAAAVSLFATYWDDAWHTDLGRDNALIAPHLTLYGAVGVAGLVVLGWGLRCLARTRSIRAVLGWPPLLLAGLGGAVTLAAAPVDAWWHASFGRDAVLWSPPHVLVVFASATMLVGVLAGLRRSRRGLVEAVLAAGLIGGLAMLVLEYDTDVPQFSETLYLPVLLAAGLLAAAIVRALAPTRYPVAAAVACYVVLRLAVLAGLAALGRSTPDLWACTARRRRHPRAAMGQPTP